VGDGVGVGLVVELESILYKRNGRLPKLFGKVDVINVHLEQRGFLHLRTCPRT
jgi:hypothetical protein